MKSLLVWGVLGYALMGCSPPAKPVKGKVEIHLLVPPAEAFPKDPEVRRVPHIDRSAANR